jgi:hypothetical protein
MVAAERSMPPTLALLAPDIVEAILGGRQLADLQLEDLLRRFSVGGRTANRHVEFGWTCI